MRSNNNVRKYTQILCQTYKVLVILLILIKKIALINNFRSFYVGWTRNFIKYFIVYQYFKMFVFQYLRKHMEKATVTKRSDINKKRTSVFNLD